MEIILKEAKNGQKTFLIKSVYFHSVYDPDKEAARFVEAIKLPFEPKYLFLVEAGLKYCIKYFKQKYPNAKIYNIKMIDSKELPLEKDDILEKDFDSFLQTLEPSDLINSEVVYWPLTNKIFDDATTKKISLIFYENLKLCKTILITKQFFEKKWLKNSLLFLNNIKNVYKINKISNDILIVASGPSLENSIDFIKENQNKIIIFALSSAINILIKNGIKPDLCLSTDGGFWAKKHLYPLLKNNIPLAFAIEGAVPKKILQSSPIIPLVYEQGLSARIYKKTNLPFSPSLSFSTVSQTAVSFAQNLTSKNIYIIGLDLCTRKGASHSKANILEIEDSTYDNKINSRIKRISTREIRSEQSLDTYTKAFLQRKYPNCYRIIDEKITTHLDSMFEISHKEFNSILQKKENIEKKNLIELTQTVSTEQRLLIKQIIKNFINENSSNKEWKSFLFPLDYCVLDHLTLSEKNDKIKEINKKNEEFVFSLQKILND